MQRLEGRQTLDETKNCQLPKMSRRMGDQREEFCQRPREPFSGLETSKRAKTFCISTRWMDLECRIPVSPRTSGEFIGLRPNLWSFHQFGKAAKLQELEIRWRDGSQSHHHLQNDQFLGLVYRNSGTSSPGFGRQFTGWRVSPNERNPWNSPKSKAAWSLAILGSLGDQVSQSVYSVYIPNWP